MTNRLAIGVTLILAGTFILLNYFGASTADTLKTISYLMMFYGVMTVLTSMQDLKRGNLFFVGIVLNGGIFLYIINSYEILNWYNLVLPALLYVVGASSLLLFFENTKEKIFLFRSLFFLLLSTMSIIFFDWNIIQVAHRVSIILLDYWQLLLILFGVIIITGGSRKRLPSS